MKRWTRRNLEVAIFDKNYLFFPVFHNSHYYLITVDLPGGVLYLYEPLGSPKLQDCDVVEKWLRQEAVSRNHSYNFHGFRQVRMYSDSNRLQKDGHNCAIYLMLIAYSICLHSSSEPDHQLINACLDEQRRRIHQCLVHANLSLVDQGQMAKVGLTTTPTTLIVEGGNSLAVELVVTTTTAKGMDLLPPEPTSADNAFLKDEWADGDHDPFDDFLWSDNSGSTEQPVQRISPTCTERSSASESELWAAGTHSPSRDYQWLTPP